MAEKEELAIQVTSRALLALMRYILEQKNIPTSDKTTIINNLEKKLQSKTDLPQGINLNEHVDIDNNKFFKKTLKSELKRLDVPNKISFNETTNKFHVFFPSNERDKVNISLENTIIKISDKDATKEKTTIRTNNHMVDNKKTKKPLPIRRQIKLATERSEQKNTVMAQSKNKTIQRDKSR